MTGGGGTSRIGCSDSPTDAWPGVTPVSEFSIKRAQSFHVQFANPSLLFRPFLRWFTAQRKRKLTVMESASAPSLPAPASKPSAGVRRRWPFVVVGILATAATAAALNRLRSTDDGVFLYAPVDANAWVVVTYGPSESGWVELKLRRFPKTYPDARSWIQNQWKVIDARVRGTCFGFTNGLPLHAWISLDWERRGFSGTNLSIYCAPGVNGQATTLFPLVRSNETGIHPVHTPIARLLSSNGLTMVRLSSSKFKIYPTAEAAKYANAPVE